MFRFGEGGRGRLFVSREVLVEVEGDNDTC
jgi:hypothetical protein